MDMNTLLAKLQANPTLATTIARTLEQAQSEEELTRAVILPPDKREHASQYLELLFVYEALSDQIRGLLEPICEASETKPDYGALPRLLKPLTQELQSVAANLDSKQRKHCHWLADQAITIKLEPGDLENDPFAGEDIPSIWQDDQEMPF